MLFIIYLFAQWAFPKASEVNFSYLLHLGEQRALCDYVWQKSMYTHYCIPNARCCWLFTCKKNLRILPRASYNFVCFGHPIWTWCVTETLQLAPHCFGLMAKNRFITVIQSWDAHHNIQNVGISKSSSVLSVTWLTCVNKKKQIIQCFW